MECSQTARLVVFVPSSDAGHSSMTKEKIMWYQRIKLERVQGCILGLGYPLCMVPGSATGCARGRERV